ncbi:MAG: tail fiber domain-containing protein, partial [Candidatus Pacebacteria bacterium]|nr:tail fiber domain-containing protein [Candidatus Paceibacterota bacterium]
GNVGIATTTPYYPLDVAGDAGFTNTHSRNVYTNNNKLGIGYIGDLTGDNTSGAYGVGYSMIRANGTGLVIGTDNAGGDIRFIVNDYVNVEAVITNAGLGIGTTTPYYPLDVAGTGRFSGNSMANSFIKHGGTSTQFLKADGSVDSNTYLTSAYTGFDSRYLKLTGGTLTGPLNGTDAIFSGKVSLSSNNKVILDGENDGFTGIFASSGGYLPDGSGGLILSSVTGIVNVASIEDSSFQSIKAQSFIVHGGTSTQFLKADGSVDSNVYLTASAGLVSGSSTEIQFNNAGVFGASSNFTWNNTSQKLHINGGIEVNNASTNYPGLEAFFAYASTEFNLYNSDGGNFLISNVDASGSIFEFSNQNGNPFLELSAASSTAEFNLTNPANSNYIFTVTGNTAQTGLYVNNKNNGDLFSVFSDFDDTYLDFADKDGVSYVHFNSVGSSYIGTDITDNYFGIGNANPNYALHVGTSTRVDAGGISARFENTYGTCDIDISGFGISCSSDQRLKKNITSVEDDVLTKIINLRTVEFNWNKENDTDVKHTGFIAQEIEQIFPNLVSTDSKSGFKSVAYGGLVPYLVKGINQLASKTLDLNSTSSALLFANIGSSTLINNTIQNSLNNLSLFLASTTDISISSTTLANLNDLFSTSSLASIKALTNSLTLNNFTLNLNGNALVNVKAIESASLNWKIGADGIIYAKEIRAEKYCNSDGSKCIDITELSNSSNGSSNGSSNTPSTDTTNTDDTTSGSDNASSSPSDNTNGSDNVVVDTSSDSDSSSTDTTTASNPTDDSSSTDTTASTPTDDSTSSTS